MADLGDSGDATLGSNGIGIGSLDTAKDDGMVLANPHFPWRRDGEILDGSADGARTVRRGRRNSRGFPPIGIGFNQDLAWTHTVSTDYRFTFYQLSLVPGDPTSYYVDGTP